MYGAVSTPESVDGDITRLALMAGSQDAESIAQATIVAGVIIASQQNKENKENQNQSPSESANPDANGDGEGPTVYRYVGEEEAAAAEEGGTIPNTDRGGNPKDVYVTPDRHESASEAEDALQIGSKNPNGATPTPTHRIEGDATGVQFDQAGRVEGGTGTELTTREEIPVRKVEPIEEE